MTASLRPSCQERGAAIGRTGNDRDICCQAELGGAPTLNPAGNGAGRHDRGEQVRSHARFDKPIRPPPRHRVITGFQGIVLVGEVKPPQELTRDPVCLMNHPGYPGLFLQGNGARQRRRGAAGDRFSRSDRRNSAQNLRRRLAIIHLRRGNRASVCIDAENCA